MCLQIDDLMDLNMVMQGQPGYANETVNVEDLVIAVDGQEARGVPLDTLHQMLKGTRLPRARALPHNDALMLHSTTTSLGFATSV